MNDWQIYAGYLLIFSLCWSFGYACGHANGFTKAIKLYRVVRLSPIYYFRNETLTPQSKFTHRNRQRL